MIWIGSNIEIANSIQTKANATSNKSRSREQYLRVTSMEEIFQRVITLIFEGKGDSLRQAIQILVDETGKNKTLEFRG